MYIMNVVNHIKHTRRVTGLFRNGWSEMPLSISLAVSGLAVQLYASYNLVTASNGARLRIPFMNYGLQDAQSTV